MRRTTSLTGRLAALVVVGIALAGTHAQGQGPPRLAFIQPLGGNKGGSFELTVTGQLVDKAQTLHFDFPGVKVEKVGDVAPDPKTPPKKGMAAGPQASQKFKVTLPADAPLGIHDVRLVTENGVSNPRAFVISDQKQVIEKETNDDVPVAQKIEINSSISGGVANPTDVDYYLFSGKKGQRIVAACLTTSVDSKLPAHIQLYSVGGSYLGMSRAYANNDAVLDATLPADGDYYVRVCSFTYTVGGPEYFYHLTITTAPWIDSVDPVAIEPGKETKVTVWGRNLPGGTPDKTKVIDGRTLDRAVVSVKAPSDPRALQRLEFSGTVLPPSAALDGMELRLKNDAGSSNPFPLVFAAAPIALDNGDNDTPEKAQKLTLPCEVSGRVEKRGDKDCYAFNAKKGEPVYIELFGERLGAPHDLYFNIRDDKGTNLTEQDENPETTSPLFYTRSEDPPRYRFVPPADGVYHLIITSREAFAMAGPRHAYLAKIGPDIADFHLVAMPATTTPEGVTLNQGGHQACTVYAFREGSFTGEIALSAEKLPPGLSMPPQTISFGQKSGAFVLSAAPEAPPTVAPIKIIGTALIGGKKVVREVRPASITWPSVAPPAPGVALVSRLDREFVVAVRGQASYAIVAEKPAISAPPGGTVNIPIKLTIIKPDFKQPVNVTVLNPPPGLIPQPVTLAGDKKTGVLTLNSKAPVPPGVYTLVLRAQTGPIGKAPPPKGPPPPNIVEVAPPFTLTVVPKSVGKLSVEPTNLKIAAGKTAELTVRVERQFDYPGEFKVEVSSAKGEIATENATIKEGTDQARITLKALPAAKAGGTTQLTIRATAQFAGTPIVHEMKSVTVQVTK